MWALQLCIKGTQLLHILYAVNCSMSCTMGTAVSYIACCVLPHVLCHGHCHFLLLYAIYCHVLWALSLCAKGTTASYIVYCALQYCYMFCVNSTAAPYSICCCGHCHFVPQALLLNTLYVVDRHIFRVHYCFIYVVCCD